MAIVVIDPGHGGNREVGGSSANNAEGPTGLLEKTVTLELGLRTRDLLVRQGIDVYLTRDDDRNLSLADRAAVAKEVEADAFVSIHLNGFNGKAQGTETFHHTQARAASKALAAAVQAGVLRATDLKDRGVKVDQLGVLRPEHHAPDTAACLVEVSFMDVQDEEARLKTNAYKDAVSQALASAILGWLLADQRIRPEIVAARPEQWRITEKPRGFMDKPLVLEDGFSRLHMEVAGLSDAPDRPDGPKPRHRGGRGKGTTPSPVDFFVEPGAKIPPKAAGVPDLDRMSLGWRTERLFPTETGIASPEAIIGLDESLDAVFLDIMAKRRKGVCIIWTSGIDSQGRSGDWMGTGFLVAPDILLTNHHVLNSPEVAGNATVSFDFERGAPDLQQSRNAPPQRGREYRLNPDRLFVTSPYDGGLDFTFVGIDQVPAADGGVSRMERAAFVIRSGERAFLIHHPGGKPKRVSLEDTDIVGARPDGAVIHYTTDTEPGSSGSPVFDRTGRLIALHHASRANDSGLADSAGVVSRFVNEGIKIAAIALELENRRARRPDPMIDNVLNEIYGADTLAGFFGAAGRRVRDNRPGAERVVDTYSATVQDIDVGFWNIEWFANRYSAKLDEVATLITDLGLDIWALVETSPKATEALVRRIEEKFGLRLECLHSEPRAPTSKQTTSVLWNPATVDGTLERWPPELEELFALRSEDFDLGPEAAKPKPGKIFDRHPGLFRFQPRQQSGALPDFYLVPVHLKAMEEGWERRRMASQILAHAVQHMVDQHHADADWIIGGDFNAELESGDFGALTKARFVPLSAQDEAEGALTYLKSPRSLIEHVFLSPNMSRLYGPQDFFILAKEKSQVDYLKRFSDHRPVLLRLSAADGAERQPAPVRDIGAQIAARLAALVTST
ncbi:N-acetylmuramoyl-L-alanine amidase [Azospirillum baldaniorum]|uniref:N-acetylmuramoyl-L-alanine amidase n=1 Tax=Azospirillum baldaniorum TaxID=1064539 RepID=UPI00119E417A|nr:N-acetylmuramoyl-L-alanine amidase [Azospirillum baldaniorum]TWA53191.1 N-acetylmuramoyl-L-alanine amidase [Azospirillum baldaniorum]